MKGDTLILSQIYVIITQEVNDMSKEVFTKIIHKSHGQLAPGVTSRDSVEFVAPDDMYIIGVSYGKAANDSGGQSITAIARTGVFKEMGSYTEGEIFVSDDQCMFNWSTYGIAKDAPPPICTDLHMLPEGIYFFLEKGERIYMHTSAKNGHATASYYFAISVNVYYTKTKP